MNIALGGGQLDISVSIGGIWPNIWMNISGSEVHHLLSCNSTWMGMDAMWEYFKIMLKLRNYRRRKSFLWVPVLVTSTAHVLSLTRVLDTWPDSDGPHFTFCLFYRLDCIFARLWDIKAIKCRNICLSRIRMNKIWNQKEPFCFCWSATEKLTPIMRARQIHMSVLFKGNSNSRS